MQVRRLVASVAATVMVAGGEDILCWRVVAFPARTLSVSQTFARQR